MPLRERCLVILDDDLTVARTIGFVAEGLDFVVHCVQDPAQFFEVVHALAPSHVAIDLIMPGMDGVEVLRQLALAGCPSAVILTSGMGQKVLEAAQATAFERGLNIAGVLPKPFRPSMLRELLVREAPTAGVERPARVQAPLSPDALHAAIEARRIGIVAQPKLELASGRVVGAEILARRQDPALGFVPPDVFVPLAEANGMMQPLTLLVLERALDWFATSALRAQGGSISVNLSTSCLPDVVLADRIQAACDRAGVPPGRLILEITESTAMDRTADSFDTLTRLRLKGFSLSVDDFGTGYSSLAQLARLPLSEIKIDRSFVMRLLDSEDARKIVDATIRLAEGMDLVSVAEGVEDAAVQDAVAQLGCTLAQGYHISRPLPVDDFDAWLRARG